MIGQNDFSSFSSHRSLHLLLPQPLSLYASFPVFNNLFKIRFLFIYNKTLTTSVSTSSPSSSSLSMCDNFLSMTFSQALDAQLGVQMKELYYILHFQARVLSFNQRRRQLGTLLKTMEWKALYLMKRKEKDLARATKKTMELEACLKKAEMESEWWERLAKANEAMVMNLSNAMEQDKEELIRVNNNITAEDTKSHCCSSCD
ncbi:putative BOI-related E3 ubiquitin-protein ligase 2 isoform X2 [Gossypium australe]|uniref:Putative BOI-related E3 ubiquitin-protein ligase 2 isoform X2 n=1 Tax=Gossypium australe TaxID=47621 RepID=A0A5B6W636_9ROSI|nr:putative BOI-related E3 ubiquitin-protein ligase 2 isoform X2 [Gossypium australe]